MEPEREEYKGHLIEVRPRGGLALRAGDVAGEPEAELLINGAKIDYGHFPDGTYFLHEYAYDWTDNLTELARRLVDYHIKTDQIRLERQSNRGD